MTPSRSGGDAMNRTILLVDDDPVVRHLCAQALVREGYRIYEASNGVEAIAVFDEHRDRIDLLVTDMRMPAMGGSELARILRARQPSLKMLCISGFPGSDPPDPCTDFLGKPFSRDVLVARVAEILRRE